MSKKRERLRASFHYGRFASAGSHCNCCIIMLLLELLHVSHFDSNIFFALT